MKKLFLVLGIMSTCLMLFGVVNIQAQQPQIPTLQVCNQTRVYGKGLVKIISRKDALHNGTFTVYIDQRNPIICSSVSGYPRGKIIIHNINMSDSLIQGAVISTYIEQVTTTGKHTPTVYIKGRCMIKSRVQRKIKGCRFWIMIADNKRKDTRKGTPDIVSFLVFDANGKRIAYGTGPVVKGDLNVRPTPN